MSTTPIKPGSPELAALLERIAEGAADRELNQQAPHEVIGWIKDAGLGRLRVPEAEGGAGASVREFFETLIALAEADGNVAHILRTHYWFVEAALSNPDPAARSRGLALINDNKLVGNAFSEQSKRPTGLYFDTTLEADGDGYRLNGKKFYSTGSLFSDYTQVWSSTSDGRIAGAVIPVDRDGVTLLDDWDGFGQKLTGTGTSVFSDVRVEPEEFFDLGDPDDQPSGYQGSFLQLYLQALTAGILRRVQADAVALVKRRARNFSHATAPQSPAADRQVLQVVGEIAADAYAAEAIVLRTAEVIQEAVDSTVDGVPDPAAAVAAQRAAAQAKIAVDGFSYATAAKLFDVGGASATQSAFNLDRHWRNIRTISTHNPTFLKASAVGDHLVNGAIFPNNAYF